MRYRHLDETVLNEYLDEALEQAARSAVEAHLEACPDCRTQLDELRMVFYSLSLIEEKPLAHDLTPIIVDRLPGTDLPLGWRLVLAVLVGVILGLLGAIGQAGVSVVRSVMSAHPLVPAWIELMSGISFRIPEVNIRPLDLPAYSLPFSAPVTIILLIAVMILWGLGNARLLKNGFEA